MLHILFYAIYLRGSQPVAISPCVNHVAISPYVNAFPPPSLQHSVVLQQCAYLRPVDYRALYATDKAYGTSHGRVVDI